MSTDPAMARLMLEGPKELKCITVNGQIIVETEDDRERCQNTHFFGFDDKFFSSGKEQRGQPKENPG